MRCLFFELYAKRSSVVVRCTHPDTSTSSVEFRLPQMSSSLQSDFCKRTSKCSCSEETCAMVETRRGQVASIDQRGISRVLMFDRRQKRVGMSFSPPVFFSSLKSVKYYSIQREAEPWSLALKSQKHGERKNFKSKAF